MHKIVIWALKLVRQMATDMIRICLSSRTNYVFQILQEVGVERKVSE